MTENEAEVLENLYRLDGLTPAGYFTPRRFGGTTGSHHAVTAIRMVEKGWTEKMRSGGGPHRPVWSYRISARGIGALGNHRALANAI